MLRLYGVEFFFLFKKKAHFGIQYIKPANGFALLPAYSILQSFCFSHPPLRSCCPIPLKNQFGTEVCCPCPYFSLFSSLHLKWYTSNLHRPDSHLHSSWVRELFSASWHCWDATDAVQRLTNEPTNWLLRAFPTTEAKQNKSHLTKCWMKWRNRASRPLQMIPVLCSPSHRSHPLFPLNLLSLYTPLSPPPPCFLWFVHQTHIDPHALDPVGGLVPLRRSTAHDWRFPYGRRRYTGGERGESQSVENAGAPSSGRREPHVIHDQWCFSNYIQIKGESQARL